MLKIILACILAIGGLFFLLAPKKYLINPAKIKDEVTMEKNIKNLRITGILFIILAIFDLFVL